MMNSATVKKDVVYSISFALMLNDWYMNIICSRLDLI